MASAGENSSGFNARVSRHVMSSSSERRAGDRNRSGCRLTNNRQPATRLAYRRGQPIMLPLSANGEVALSMVSVTSESAATCERHLLPTSPARDSAPKNRGCSCTYLSPENVPWLTCSRKLRILPLADGGMHLITVID